MSPNREPIRPKPVHVTREVIEEETVNDSLGTVDPADSTGIDDDKETGDAKTHNRPTRED